MVHSRISSRVSSTIAFILIGVSACTDSNAPSKENFAQVIDQGMGKFPVCVGSTKWNFPTLSRGGIEWSPPEIAQLDALADAGLLARRATRAEVKPTEAEYKRAVRAFLPAPEPRMETVQEYSLTPQGEAAYRKHEAVLGVQGQFCYARPRVAEVVRFTEPAAGEGQRVSTVTVRVRVDSVAPWAERPEVRRAIPEIDQALATRAAPEEGEFLVVSTSDGWVLQGRR